MPSSRNADDIHHSGRLMPYVTRQGLAGELVTAAVFNSRRKLKEQQVSHNEEFTVQQVNGWGELRLISTTVWELKDSSARKMKTMN